MFRFIEEAGRPLITEFKQEHAHKIFEMEITHHFLLFVDKAHKDFDAMLNVVSSLLTPWLQLLYKERTRSEVVKLDNLQLRTLAKEHRQRMTFVHLDVGNEEHDGIAEFFGVTKVFEAKSTS